MKNVNRDYLVKVDAKTAAIIPPRDMKFYVTDIYTCNIFFQLTINDTNSSFINAPNENADKYTLTLHVLKPDNTPLDNIKTTFMYQSGNAFYYIADLKPECTDVIGICQCELLIETEVIDEYGKPRKEISTTDPFEYEVEKSIFSNLDEAIEGLPGYPLLDSLATKDYVNNMVENIDLFDYATRDYVNQVVSGYNFDLSEYVTEQELSEALTDFSGGSSIDLSDYATKEYVNAALAAIEDYDDHRVWIGTQDKYDAIYPKDPKVIYFVVEED